jgi:RNA polymerase sigma-70 factor (ECF subfamily)
VPIEGGSEQVGSDLEAFRSYLTLLARRALAPDLAAKVATSDLVQETFLAAGRDIAQLRDHSTANLRRWLSGILQHLLANTRRSFRATQKRRTALEVAGRGSGGDSRENIVVDVAASATSPSERAMRQERVKALREAMVGLPEHYRQVIQWRNEERLTFEEIAGRLGGSSEAARKVWGRALVRLRETLGPGHDPR